MQIAPKINAYNVMPRFVPALHTFTKLSTIRAPRKDGRIPEPGELVRFYCGMRTKGCYFVSEAEIVAVLDISLAEISPMRYQILIDGLPICDSMHNVLAVRDGFYNASEMFQFFKETYSLPFSGYLIEFQPQMPTAKEVH